MSLYPGIVMVIHYYRSKTCINYFIDTLYKNSPDHLVVACNSVIQRLLIQDTCTCTVSTTFDSIFLIAC